MTRRAVFLAVTLALVASLPGQSWPVDAASSPSCAGWADPFSPPELIRIGRVHAGVVTSVEDVAFDDYVARAFAARWSPELPPAALEAGAILTRQAAWYLAMHGHEGYMLADGTCYDARDDEIDHPLAPSDAVAAAHREALDATAGVTLRLPRLHEPFFFPIVRDGEEGCGTSPIEPHPTVEIRRAAACAAQGEDAATILRRFLGPDLTVVSARSIGGPTRYETAVAASREAVPGGPAGTVFVATGANYPDALAGGPAARRLGGSLLLVPGTAIPVAVRDELVRLRPAAIRVLGGPTVVSDGVLAELRGYSADVARLSGPTRYETAIAVSRAAFAPGTERVFIATGLNYPDALAGASAGAAVGAPILLVPGTSVPSGPLAAALGQELRRLAPRSIHVLGGPTVVGDATLHWLSDFAPSVDRLAGQTRYDTSAAISAAINRADAGTLYVASGDNFPDALAAAPLGGPLLLAPSNGRWPGESLVVEARRLGIAGVAALGRNAVVPDASVVALAGGSEPPASGRLLGRYFCTALPGSPLLDAAGIPMTVYGTRAEYNPVQVSQFGLAHFERWLHAGRDEDRATFLRMADWLVASQKANGLWHYTFAYGGQPVPWWSGMAQGQAVSLLLRAHQATSESKYLESAGRAVPTMRRTIANAGTAVFPKGGYWIEEYIPPYSIYTLNGFMFSIEGLREWVAVTGDPTAAAWLKEALATLSAWLPRFDTGRWSYYNLSPPKGSTAAGSLSSIKYHVIHVIQLRHLAAVTRDPVLATFAQRWAAYAAKPPAGIRVTSIDDWLVGPTVTE